MHTQTLILSSRLPDTSITLDPVATTIPYTVGENTTATINVFDFFCLGSTPCDAPNWTVVCSNGDTPAGEPVDIAQGNATFTLTIGGSGTDVNMDGETSDVVCNLTATYTNGVEAAAVREAQITIT